MKAEIVSVGTELLLGQIVDTHAAKMGRILAECGLTCQRRSTVGDNLDRIVQTLQEALDRADVVVTIGGLGPTMDDLTRDAIAIVLGDELEQVPEVEEHLRQWFANRGARWTESIARQAQKPSSARLIENPNGTAPGLICAKGGKHVLALPGPKGEFDPMAEGPVREYLAALTGEVIHSVVLRVAGMGESHVEDLIRPLMERDSPTVAPYAHLGEVHLRITAKAGTSEEADALIAPVVEEVKAILGDRVFAQDAMTLEEALISLLARRGETVAVAESMTGGELAARLSTAPGSSSVFLGGVTCYSASAKVGLVGVDQALIQKYTVVSEEVCRSMAERIRQKMGTTYGLAVTGNAGPSADEGGKPVGLVYIGIAGPKGVEVREQSMHGVRADIRRRSTQLVLTWLRDLVLKS